jgi:hypothetical protein
VVVVVVGYFWAVAGWLVSVDNVFVLLVVSIPVSWVL